MLAVLAIIGVLSVAAVAGLMWAFAKYKANNTIHDVHLWELAALDSQQLYSMTSGQLVLNELGEVSTHGYPMAIMVQDENVFYISVDDVPKRVCSLMLDMLDETHFVTVNDVRYEGTDICNIETDSLKFYFNKYMGEVGSICIPSCTGDERCCDNTCKSIQTPCGEDGCLDCGSDYCTTTNTCCPTPDATKCGDNDCCETKCCNGVCCAESYMTCDETTTCGCPNNMVPDADTGACKCPDDAPYYFENEGICCQSGYTPVEGVCQRVDCRGGPTSYNCYINDKLCGYNCDSVGRNCVMGICYADECLESNGETFVYLSQPPGSYFYYCKKQKDQNTYCVTIYRSKSVWNCYYNNEPCCISRNLQTLECSDGTCNPEDCYALDSQAQYFTYINSYGSCLFDPNFLCYPTKNTWTCIKNNLTCGQGCSDPLNCGECNTDYCPKGTTYNSSKGYCENSEYYCVPKLGQTGQQDAYITCYQKKDDTVCGKIWYATNAFSGGSCTDPGCPDGMIYGQVSSLYWGCIDQKDGINGITCHYDRSYAPAICHYNSVLCGRRCDYNGANCGEVFLPQCALTGHCPQTGYDMSGGCICDGDVTSADGTDYCCPTGHTYINGACAMT